VRQPVERFPLVFTVAPAAKYAREPFFLLGTVRLAPAQRRPKIVIPNFQFLSSLVQLTQPRPPIPRPVVGPLRRHHNVSAQVVRQVETLLNDLAGPQPDCVIQS
jgi:hypothetical protein